jgi:hypothetical protein
MLHLRQIRSLISNSSKKDSLCMNFPFPTGTGLIVADPIDMNQRLSPGLTGAAFNTAGTRQTKAFVPALNI